jgi:Zn-dependent protease with chaperone function
MAVPAAYFDGKTSRRFSVELSVIGGTAVIRGDIERECPIDDLRVSERARNTSRKVTFPDGAFLEVEAGAAFNQLLAETGYRDSLVVSIQQSWRGTLLACIVTIMLMVAGFLYGLPAASELIAKALPERAERLIGRETLEFLDQDLLAPSALAASRRDAIIARFRALVPPREGVPMYEILFRKSKIGPNAFALPSGQIILTDEIVELLQTDDAVIGVLAHELGHLHERHLMRRIIQSSVVGAAVMALSGDASSVIVGIPTLMVDLKYSRDAEREADDYAIAMLKANGISLSNLTLLFEKIQENSENSSAYLSSHPPAYERIERIRNAR